MGRCYQSQCKNRAVLRLRSESSGLQAMVVAGESCLRISWKRTIGQIGLIAFEHFQTNKI